jgi:hypothetical protein
MMEISHECKELTNVQLCDHAKSCFQIVASNIWNICITHGNESMQLNMIFNWMEDGLGSLVC